MRKFSRVRDCRGTEQVQDVLMVMRRARADPSSLAERSGTGTGSETPIDVAGAAIGSASTSRQQGRARQIRHCRVARIWRTRG